MTLEEITIRTVLKPGDIGAVTRLHGVLYAKEEGYGIDFEAYVAQGLAEFWQQYDATRDRAWICERAGNVVGFGLMMHRSAEVVQFRYFILAPECRGIGLGKKLMTLMHDFIRERGYKHVYLWTAKGLDTAAALYERFGYKLTEEKPTTAFGREVIEQRYDLDL